MDKNLDERISLAVQKGEEAFWATVAAEFPEVTTGDLDPSTTISLTEKMRSAIAAWVEYNRVAE